MARQIATLLLLCLAGALGRCSCAEDAVGAASETVLPAAAGTADSGGSGGGGGELPAGHDSGPLDRSRLSWQDDSVRCRMSGICDGPLPAGCGSPADLPASGGSEGEGGGEGEESRDPLACLTTDEERAAAVVDAARHAWSGYRDCAWGEDELLPLSCSGAHWFNLSLTMVDSLDTLYLLGMTREFEEAATWLADHLDVGAPSEVNLFETTIRVLGGLLSAQALSAGTHPALSQRLAEKAAELGARLMPAFESPSGVPWSDVNLRTGQASPPTWGHASSLSEMCSVSLEFTYLARITGHALFEQVPLAVHQRLEAHIAGDAGGLLGQYFDPRTGKAHLQGTTITLGARSDSYYEYLLKQWLLTGKTEGWLRKRYVQAMRSVRSRLLRRTAGPGRPGLWYLAEQLKGGQLSGKMDHLVCFLPGLLALGDLHGVSTALSDGPHGYPSRPTVLPTHLGGCPASSIAGGAAAGTGNAAAAGGPEGGSHAGSQQQAQQQQQEGEGQGGPAGGPASSGTCGVNSTSGTSGEDMPDLQLAAELALTCAELYRRTPAGLAPEIAHFASHADQPDFPNKHFHDVGHGDFSIKPNDAHNLLRPETVESLYLLWKVTGDPLYKHWAWQAFRAFERWARVRPSDRHDACAACMAEAAFEAAKSSASAAAADAGGAAGQAAAGAAAAGGSSEREQRRAALLSATAQLLQRQLSGGEVCAACSGTGGYTSLESVLAVPPARRDKMESFFLAETIKYLYLVFTEPPDRCLHPSCQAGAAGAEAAAAGAADTQQQQPQGASSAGGGNSSSSSSGTGAPRAARRRQVLPLDRFVFTTEAHPLPIVGPSLASTVGRVLDPGSPLLRPHNQEKCPAGGKGGSAKSSGSSNGGGGPATLQQRRRWRRTQQVQQQSILQQVQVIQLGEATAEAIAKVLDGMLNTLSEAGAANGGGSSNGGEQQAAQQAAGQAAAGSSPPLPACGGQGAAGSQAAAEEEEDEYEDVGDEEEDEYADEEEEAAGRAEQSAAGSSPAAAAASDSAAARSAGGGGGGGGSAAASSVHASPAQL